MTSRHVSPAIYAGLAGAALYAVPTCAHAVELTSTSGPFTNSALTFVAGCLAGAVVSSGMSIAAERIMASREERKEAEAMFATHARHAAEAAGAARSAQAAAEAVEARVGKHARHSATEDAVRSWEQTGTIRVQEAPRARHAASGFTADEDSLFEAKHFISNDYADVADAYVKKITLAERMSARAKGVANVLSERLGASKMEGLPVIARADGSVADMGESWWQNAFADDQVIGAQSAASAAEPFASFAQIETPAAQAQVNGDTAKSHAQLNPESSEFIYVSQAQKPAEANAQAQMVQTQPSYEGEKSQVEVKTKRPAHAKLDDARWSEEQQDLWAVALSALDDRFAEQIAMGPETSVGFADEIGDADSIDDPEGIEPITTFMSFKPTAGHPEVQDTNSYVDLLIDQEFAHNSSVAARKSVRGVLRNYLTVVDGGTGELKPKKSSGPAHMMPVAQIAY